MARRLIGYGYTNSNGVATLDYDASGTSISPSGYTGVGAGAINIQAELHDDSTVVSEPYTVIDAIILDTMAEDTTANYYDNSNLTFSNGSFVLTGGASNRWFQLGGQYGYTTDLSRFKGKTIKLECDVSSITGKARVTLQENAGSTQTQGKSGDWVSSNGTMSVTLDNPISDTATRIYMRIYVENEGNTVTLNNFRVYPV